MSEQTEGAEVEALATWLMRGRPSGPAAIHFCPWPECLDIWESEPSCVHAQAIALLVDRATAEALNLAADEARREARWQTEQFKRATDEVDGLRHEEAQLAVSRVSRILRARAAVVAARGAEDGGGE